MASLINVTSSMLAEGYNFYLWTLSIAGKHHLDKNCIKRKVKFSGWYVCFVDNRTRGWLMVDSPIPTLSYTLLYLGMVAIGPRLMKNRKPFRLKQVMLIYNLFMAALNAYIAEEVTQ